MLLNYAKPTLGHLFYLSLVVLLRKPHYILVRISYFWCKHPKVPQ